MDNKYIFVPYEGKFDANILSLKEKKINVSSACYPFQIYELYFSININLVSNER